MKKSHFAVQQKLKQHCKSTVFQKFFLKKSQPFYPTLQFLGGQEFRQDSAVTLLFQVTSVGVIGWFSPEATLAEESKVDLLVCPVTWKGQLEAVGLADPRQPFSCVIKSSPHGPTTEYPGLLTWQFRDLRSMVKTTILLQAEPQAGISSITSAVILSVRPSQASPDSRREETEPTCCWRKCQRIYCHLQGVVKHAPFHGVK